MEKKIICFLHKKNYILIKVCNLNILCKLRFYPRIGVQRDYVSVYILCYLLCFIAVIFCSWPQVLQQLSSLERLKDQNKAALWLKLYVSDMFFSSSSPLLLWSKLFVWVFSPLSSLRHPYNRIKLDFSFYNSIFILFILFVNTRYTKILTQKIMGCPNQRNISTIIK